MRKIFYIIICGFMCSLLVSCSFINKYDPGFVLRSMNQKHLKLLNKGMTEDEVLAIMGKPQIQDNFKKANILFYYTTWDWADAAVNKTVSPVSNVTVRVLPDWILSEAVAVMLILSPTL